MPLYLDHVSIPISSAKTSPASSARRTSRVSADDAGTSTLTHKQMMKTSKPGSSIVAEHEGGSSSPVVGDSSSRRALKNGAETRRRTTDEQSPVEQAKAKRRPGTASRSTESVEKSTSKSKKRSRQDYSGLGIAGSRTTFSDGIQGSYETPSAKRRRLSTKGSKISLPLPASSEEPEGDLIVAMTSHQSDDSDDPMLLRDPPSKQKRKQVERVTVPDSVAESSLSPAAPSPARDEPPSLPENDSAAVQANPDVLIDGTLAASTASPSASITAHSPPDPAPAIAEPVIEPQLACPAADEVSSPKDAQPRAETPVPTEGVLIDVPLANALQLLASEIKDMRREVREYADAQVEAVRREFQAYKDIMSKQLLHAEDRAQRSESMVRNYISWGVNPAYFYSGPPAPAVGPSEPSPSTRVTMNGVADESSTSLTVQTQQDAVGSLDTHALASAYPQPDGTVDNRTDTIGDAAALSKISALSGGDGLSLSAEVLVDGLVGDDVHLNLGVEPSLLEAVAEDVGEGGLT